MVFKLIYVLCFIWTIILEVSTKEESINKYKLCVVQEMADDLMAGNSFINKVSIENENVIELVTGRDILQCMEMVLLGTSDAMLSIDIEPILIGNNTEKYRHLKVFLDFYPAGKEIYLDEAIVVVRKNLQINTLNDLKDQRSCFKKVTSDEGFKIPYMKLKALGILKERYDPHFSIKENQLKEFSSFFTHGCIPHHWSPLPDIDEKLKMTYSNLHSLCKYDPNKPIYENNFELECLTKYGGNIAWSTREDVETYFKINEDINQGKDTETKLNSEEYMYLCPNGTKISLRGEMSCSWAKKTWIQLLTNPEKIQSMIDLKSKMKEGLENLFSKVGTEHDSIQSFVIDTTSTDSLDVVLQKNNYTNIVIEEKYDGHILRTVNFCVKSELELTKCQTFSKISFVMNYRPSFNCILKNTVAECLEFIKTEGGIYSVDPYYLDIAKNEYNLKPVMAEWYNIKDHTFDVVAVVKKTSKFQSLNELRGARSCHTGFGTTSGYTAPLYILMKAGLIEKKSCPFPKTLSEFFSGGSCLPGSFLNENDLQKTNPKILCSQCSAPNCNPDYTEIYYGDTGALRCLAEEKGDVAFMRHVYAVGLTGHYFHDEMWAGELNITDFELLCPNGTRVSLTEKCSLITEPPFMIVTRSTLPQTELDEIRDVLAETSKYFYKNKYHLSLFGRFDGKQNLLFQDITSKLVPAEDFQKSMDKYSQIIKDIRDC